MQALVSIELEIGKMRIQMNSEISIILIKTASLNLQSIAHAELMSSPTYQAREKEVFGLNIWLSKEIKVQLI